MSNPETVTPFEWPDEISGGKRANLMKSDLTDDWWVGIGKDESCQFEGPWEHMVELARQVLAVEEQRVRHSGGSDQ